MMSNRSPQSFTKHEVNQVSPPTQAGPSSLQLTVVVCTCRLESAVRCCRQIRSCLSPADLILVVLDCADDTSALRSELAECGAETICNVTNLGLSYSRNLALEVATLRHIMFVDDDVWLNYEVVDGVRAAFASGSAVVGVRLLPSAKVDLDRWFLTPSQFHYLGIHRSDRKANTWGACMGVDASVVRSNGLTFKENLGRAGTGLQSGDDTTLIRELVRCGERESFLDGLSVEHRFDPKRVQLYYLVRRAYWQGRSEVRRSNALRGLWKEVRRNCDTDSVRGLLLAFLYVGSVVGGISFELLSGGVARIRGGR